MSSNNNLKTSDLHAKLAELQLKQQQEEEEEQKQAEGRLRREAEAEAELRREIAEVEECEREAALRLEEDWRAVEMQRELEKLWEAERRMAENIRRAQVSSLRMVEAMEVDIEDGGDRGARSLEGTEDEEEEEEAKTKKGKKEGRWEIVRGSGRCKACQKEGTSCMINLRQIELWRQRVQKGKKFTVLYPPQVNPYGLYGMGHGVHGIGHGPHGMGYKRQQCFSH